MFQIKIRKENIEGKGEHVDTHEHIHTAHKSRQAECGVLFVLPPEETKILVKSERRLFLAIIIIPPDFFPSSIVENNNVAVFRLLNESFQRYHK